ncbi:helix-hairpin-helix domain-containing protein [Actinomadura montaniterrae]|uniref:Helix-hairpin-helix domain-containing protein n=1 Tax=Actinomadura montaniterrae TaxID=1803903 RepID=A0A6L3VVH7_9ACTN|nr:hypothetical protein [Actinomadura montaniterrae]KAB2379953.1 hypothetical protein F9B16_18820 [Actinomadura montaniterrae]
MTTLAQLRKAALSYPGTAEDAAPGIVAFTVDGKRFASMGDDGLVELRLPASDVDELLAAHPTARGAAPGGVRVPIGDVNGQQLNHWVRRAWLAQAPARPAARVAAGDAARPGEVGDLPKAIGGPATRALAGAGITTLAEVAALTDAELLAMHGVGPKAVRILREALA